MASGRVVGIPIILLLAMALTAAASWFMHGTVYGRQLSAVGQNSRAAYFAGIKVEQTTRIAYVLSALLAALGGLLLSGRVSGAFLEMGTPFLLQSVGAVVVGGSSIVVRNGVPPRHPSRFNLSCDDCHDNGCAPRAGRIFRT